jgi:hypothetical protein
MVPRPSLPPLCNSTPAFPVPIVHPIDPEGEATRRSLRDLLIPLGPAARFPLEPSPLRVALQSFHISRPHLDTEHA